MFEGAEIGQKLSSGEFRQHIAVLRNRLLELQRTLRDQPFPLLIVLDGMAGAGKTEVMHRLHEWFDPRWLRSFAFVKPNTVEASYPSFRRYWLSLPKNGSAALYLNAWYAGLLNGSSKQHSLRQLEQQVEEIRNFEQVLSDSGVLIVKFWLHLGEREQKQRLRELEKNPATRARVKPRDWQTLKRHRVICQRAEHMITATSTASAPWFIVEATDRHYRDHRIGDLLKESLERHLTQVPGAAKSIVPKKTSPNLAVDAPIDEPPTVLSSVKLSKSLSRSDYESQLQQQQARLSHLAKKAYARKVGMVAVFEGWDAAGKGGAIRRLSRAIDPCHFQVVAVGPPNDEERSHPYLWRFWRDLPASGKITIFDRSWYGRVLVERVEGFAERQEWQRAYSEIRDFETHLRKHGYLLLKFWLHISPEEQLKRFRAREATDYKRWKITDEDWRNRARWADYANAVHEMVERTSTQFAPWRLIPANDKRHARIRVLKEMNQALDSHLANNSPRKASR